jgi:hypothetical protein
VPRSRQKAQRPITHDVIRRREGGQGRALACQRHETR